jgi:predicted ATPase/class 3 adenylate cyclase
MTELPTGTVTFLFTDIEGSTRLIQRLGERYPGLLDEHGRLMREAVTHEDGIVVSTEGDSFFVAFHSPGEAVRAATAAQRALAEQDWPDSSAVRVRMGIHTGEGTRGGENYVGLDVHRAARIAAAAHGGQILISSATRALVENSLPDGVTSRDLGDHRLRDIEQPERLYQLAVRDLPSDFPPPKTLDARPNNLPTRLTRFIGRAPEIMAVEDLLENTRLLTLTGPGGTGKTRLSLQVASELLPRFQDGAFFVDLSPITDPSLVPTSIADAVGAKEEPGRSVADTLKDHLRDKELLLVLDNFEQVTQAADVVLLLLNSAPRLKILVTSRIVLHLSGEQEYPVLPLALPDPDHLPDLDTLSQFEAVALFIDRARAVKPDFEVTNENAPAVAEICARLDGLPLAIELAAVRVKLLSPQSMVARLAQRLPLLTGGARDLPERQRTLRGAIEWSHDLLDEPKRQLFARLAVFMGGCTLEAAEAVCGADLDVLDALASLVDESLLRRTETPDGEVRFGMLETIREFAAERLAQSGEEEDLGQRHAEWMMAFAEEAEPHLIGEDQVLWLGRAEQEHDNARTALQWALDHDRGETGIRIAASLWRFWQQRGHLRAGRKWLDDLLALPSAAARTAARGKALGAAGSLAYWLNDKDATEARYRESVDIFREVGDRGGLADALYNLAFIPMLKRDLEEAQALFDQAGVEAEAVGNRLLLAHAKSFRAYADLMRGNPAAAVEPLKESAAIIRELGHKFDLADNLGSLAGAYHMSGDFEAAHAAYRESMELFREANNPTGMNMLLHWIAAMAADEGQFRRAVRLEAAYETTREEIGGGAPPELMTIVRDPLEPARKALGAEEFEEALEEGRALGLEKAVAYALEEDGS